MENKPTLKQTKSNISNISTYLRIRPFNGKEKQNGMNISCLTLKDDSVFITNKQETTVLNSEAVNQLLEDGNVKQFNYDKVFDTTTSQQEIFEEVGVKALNQVLDGYNSTVVAFGVTGSGKTHTITGYFDQTSNSLADPSSEMYKFGGIYPRLLHCLIKGNYNPDHEMIQDLFGDKFHNVEDMQIFAANVEIYNEQFRDLSIDPKLKQKDIKIVEGYDGPEVTGLTYKPVENYEEGMKFYQQCLNNRMVASTMMSVASSRSHAIYTLKLLIKFKDSKLCKSKPPLSPNY